MYLPYSLVHFIILYVAYIPEHNFFPLSFYIYGQFSAFVLLFSAPRNPLGLHILVYYTGYRVELLMFSCLSLQRKMILLSHTVPSRLCEDIFLCREKKCRFRTRLNILSKRCSQNCPRVSQHVRMKA